MPAADCAGLVTTPPEPVLSMLLLLLLLQVSLSRVFATMAGSSAVELGVIDWAVANATMEEVFIRIAQQMKLKATE